MISSSPAQYAIPSMLMISDPLPYTRYYDYADLLDNTEAIRIVPLEVARAHESEDGHRIVQDAIGNEAGQFGCDQ